MDEKWSRTLSGIATLRDKLHEMRPDVLVIFGDDQAECFDFKNFPSLAVYVGDEISGRVPGSVAFEERGSAAPPPQTKAPGSPKLATSILTGLIADGFDPAFLMDLPKPERGMCHAVMNPLKFFTDYEIPSVPVLVNAYYAPQMTAARCYEVGKSVRKAIDAYPEDLRVVAIGSGGLWHTPGRKNSWLNEEFDQAGLDFLVKGDIKSWAEYFDTYKVPSDDTSQDISEAGNNVTGLPSLGGPQYGTRETQCWIAAAALAEGRPSVVVDYVPIYASPVGNGFAYCEDIA
jgi:hypothetical protein